MEEYGGAAYLNLVPAQLGGAGLPISWLVLSLKKCNYAPKIPDLVVLAYSFRKQLPHDRNWW